jgi:uncharacterized membrane protein
MRKILFWLMPPLYIITGIIHFINRGFYVNIMPQWLPAHLELTYFSGAVEILLGIFLIPAQTRKISAWLIIAMLVVFFFVIHIPAAIKFYNEHDPLFWVALVRLPIQFYLVWWALKYTRPARKPVQ